MQNKQGRAMTAVGILLYIQNHKSDLPNLKRMTPAQVLARLREKDARYDDKVSNALRQSVPKA